MISADTLVVQHAALPDDQLEGLLLILQQTSAEASLEEARQLLQQPQTGQWNFEHFFLATATRQPETSSPFIVGSGLVIVQPDGAALLWPFGLHPELDTESDQDLVVKGLLQALRNSLSRKQVWHFQVSLSEGLEIQARLLLANGFRELGKMQFLQRLCGISAGQPENSDVNMQLVPFSQVMDQSTFALLIEQTYVDSQDYPELAGYRSGAEAVLSHQTQGTYRPDWWFVVLRDNQPAGVLLFAEHVDFRQIELTYVGVVPAHRNQQLARIAIRRALHQFPPLTPVFLGVDARNVSAVRLYESLGFEEVMRQRIFCGPVQE
ncbi:MAG: GNAT family N-acetyltransferase [Planctomycetaceae bacterium]|nr:GNAT family N-acetyltransferase [Planctomycetaceae bacterium]